MNHKDTLFETMHNGYQLHKINMCTFMEKCLNLTCHRPFNMQTKIIFDENNK